MARLRKDKGGKLRSTVPLSGNAQKTQPMLKITSKAKSQKKSLKDHVLELGGDEDDYHLVKDIGDLASVSGPLIEDPALSKDVSKFLEDLKLNLNPEPKDEPDMCKPAAEIMPKQKPRKSPKESSEVDADPVPSIPKPLPTKSRKSEANVILSPTPQWYTTLSPLTAPLHPLPPLSPTHFSTLTARASNLLVSASSSYSNSSEHSFFQTILHSGTLSDRLSALTLLVQGSPVHNTRALEGLKALAERGKGKGGRDESLKAVRCLVDWWVGGGAPERKLRYFRDQPLMNPGVTDQYLLLWYFEDWLKKYFFSILQILETLSLDPLPYVRTQALSLVFTLLRDKPEQEQNLLRLLVNKLGDTSKSICSRTSYHLLQLLQSHPSMKSIVVHEIMALVLRPRASFTTTALASPSPSTSTSAKHIRFADDRPSQKPKPVVEKSNLNTHARYYATITFNQIVLSPSPEDKDVARKLIDVYFEMFKEVIGEGGGTDDVEDKDMEKTEDGAKASKKGRGKGKRRAEVKGAAGFMEVENSNSRLMSAILTGVNRALPFAKVDAGNTGLNKHIDALFLITHTSTFNISLQALVLIHHITTSLGPPSSPSTSPISTKVADRYYRTLYASLHDARLASSSKQAMYLNLFFKSLKSDENEERVKAMVRRFVQVLVCGGVGGGSVGGGTEFVVGGLYLLGELFNTVKGLREILSNPDSAPGSKIYDPLKRDPHFAHPSSSPLYELYPLLTHYHPTISLYAKHLLASESLPSSASPDLSLNTLSHFLDRFVYKNPKQRKTQGGEGEDGSGKIKGGSAMQPAASGINGVKLVKGVRATEERVNEEEWWKRKVEDVSVDQVFFRKFFTTKNEREKAKAAKVDKKKRRGGEADSDEGSVNGEDDDDTRSIVDEVEVQVNGNEDEEDSDLEEGEIWKAIQASMPKVVGDNELTDTSDNLEVPSGLDEDDSDSVNDSEAVDAASEQALSLAEGSDNEDLLPFNALLTYDGSDVGASVEDDADEEWGGIATNEDAGQKRKRGREETKERRKRMRLLPTFASYEDYAKMIEDGPEDNV